LTIGMVTLVSLVAFEAVAVTTAMPTVTKALNGLALYGLAFGGALAAGVVGMVVSGGWSDAKGPAAPVWAGLGAFGAGLLVAGLAPTMGALVAGRIAQGFGGGLVAVALYVVVGRVYPERLHPRLFAAFAGAWVVPSVAGPSVSGLIVEHAGWRWVFLGVVLVSVPAVLLVRPALRGLSAPSTGSERAFRRARFGPIGLALGAAVSVGLLHVGGQRFRDQHPGGENLGGEHIGGLADGILGLGLIGVALAGLVVFAPRLLPRGAFAARSGLPSVVLLRGLAGAAFMQADVFLPLMLSRERGFSPSAAGLTLTVGGVAWFAGSWYQGRWGQRLAPALRLRIGLALIAAGITTAALCVAPAVPVAVCVAGWALGGLGMGISYPTMSALTLRLSAPGTQGANSSALQLSDSLFSTTMLAIGGTLFAAWVPSSPTAAYLSGYVIAGALALTGVVLAARTREPAPAEAVPPKAVPPRTEAPRTEPPRTEPLHTGPLHTGPLHTGPLTSASGDRAGATT
jgi:MFS family permease